MAHDHVRVGGSAAVSLRPQLVPRLLSIRHHEPDKPDRDEHGHPAKRSLSLRPSAETGGVRVVAKSTLTPGGSVTPHSHRVTEIFECLDASPRSGVRKRAYVEVRLRQLLFTCHSTAGRQHPPRSASASGWLNSARKRVPMWQCWAATALGSSRCVRASGGGGRSDPSAAGVDVLG
jgi:hypothetical protein